jgi:hypothetical protein
MVTCRRRYVKSTGLAIDNQNGGAKFNIEGVDQNEETHTTHNACPGPLGSFSKRGFCV